MLIEWAADPAIDLARAKAGLRMVARFEAMVSHDGQVVLPFQRQGFPERTIGGGDGSVHGLALPHVHARVWRHSPALLSKAATQIGMPVLVELRQAEVAHLTLCPLAPGKRGYRLGASDLHK